MVLGCTAAHPPNMCVGEEGAGWHADSPDVAAEVKVLPSYTPDSPANVVLAHGGGDGIGLLNNVVPEV